MAYTPSSSIPTGPITFAEVRAAVGDTDPNQINAGTVRKMLWDRGSYATIQKHLDTIRRERAPATPEAPGSAPAAPAEAVAAMWSAAWLSAQALTLGRLQTLMAERDALTEALATTRADVVALTGEVDSLADTATTANTAAAAAAEALTQAQAAHAAALANEQTAAAEAAATIADLQADLVRVKAEAAHAAELATRDARLAAQAMQMQFDRLTDQVGELKSLLHNPQAKGN